MIIYQGDDNIPRVTEVKDFYNWIEGNEHKIEQEELRQRLFSDGYLYFYQHIPSLSS